MRKMGVKSVTKKRKAPKSVWIWELFWSGIRESNPPLSLGKHKTGFCIGSLNRKKYSICNDFSHFTL